MKHPCSSVSELVEKCLDQEVTDQEKALVEAHLFDLYMKLPGRKTLTGFG
jgi:hypothetical protein